MKVGYFGNIFIKGIPFDFNERVQIIVGECKGREIKVLVCSGGISYNYHTTLKFTEELGKLCKREGISFYFIVGNTDFYYPENESTADKIGKYKSILEKYRENPYYLPSHPIFSRDVRITGFETWYDYTLYRGRPRDLKSITKKSYFFKTNDDVKYITNKSDYVAGINNTFDMIYTKQTLSAMRSKLSAYTSRWGQPKYSVLVQYFMPARNFLKDNFMENYFGTFKGSMEYLNLLKSENVTDCVIGIKCRSDYPYNMDGIKFMNPKELIQVVEYNV